jgi:4-hydroxy-2-oxoheptanedioate aldolase
MSGLRDAWTQGRAALGAWCLLPEGGITELFATAGYDYLCIDCQHGLIGYESMVLMLRAAARTGASPIVRVPSNDPAWIGRALDAGAEAVVVPLVNTPDEAARVVAACRYPPDGVRSIGPNRGVPDVMCFVMIETSAAVESADAICAVPGLDGVYVGPSDLAMNLGVPAQDQFRDAGHLAAIVHVAASSAREGVVSGLHLVNAPGDAKRWEADGFRMLTIASDLAILTGGAGRVLDVARGREASP